MAGHQDGTSIKNISYRLYRYEITLIGLNMTNFVCIREDKKIIKHLGQDTTS